MKPHRVHTELGAGFLKPSVGVVKIEGSVLYQESAQAWNTIKLKRELLFLYPQLRDKSTHLKYTMILPRSNEEIMTQMKEMIESNKMPILLFLEKSQSEEHKVVN